MHADQAAFLAESCKGPLTAIECVDSAAVLAGITRIRHAHFCYAGFGAMLWMPPTDIHNASTIM